MKLTIPNADYYHFIVGFLCIGLLSGALRTYGQDSAIIFDQLKDGREYEAAARVLLDNPGAIPRVGLEAMALAEMLALKSGESPIELSCGLYAIAISYVSGPPGRLLKIREGLKACCQHGHSEHCTLWVANFGRSFSDEDKDVLASAVRKYYAEYYTDPFKIYEGREARPDDPWEPLARLVHVDPPTTIQAPIVHYLRERDRLTKRKDGLIFPRDASATDVSRARTTLAEFKNAIASTAAALASVPCSEFQETAAARCRKEWQDLEYFLRLADGTDAYLDREWVVAKSAFTEALALSPLDAARLQRLIIFLECKSSYDERRSEARSLLARGEIGQAAAYMARSLAEGCELEREDLQVIESYKMLAGADRELSSGNWQHAISETLRLVEAYPGSFDGFDPWRMLVPAFRHFVSDAKSCEEQESRIITVVDDVESASRTTGGTAFQNARDELVIEAVNCYLRNCELPEHLFPEIQEIASRYTFGSKLLSKSRFIREWPTRLEALEARVHALIRKAGEKEVHGEIDSLIHDILSLYQFWRDGGESQAEGCVSAPPVAVWIGRVLGTHLEAQLDRVGKRAARANDLSEISALKNEVALLARELENPIISYRELDRSIFGKSIKTVAAQIAGDSVEQTMLALRYRSEKLEAAMEKAAAEKAAAEKAAAEKAAAERAAAEQAAERRWAEKEAEERAAAQELAGADQRSVVPSGPTATGLAAPGPPRRESIVVRNSPPAIPYLEECQDERVLAQTDLFRDLKNLTPFLMAETGHKRLANEARNTIARTSGSCRVGIMRMLAEFLYRSGFFFEAAELYHELVVEGAEGPGMYRRICHMIEVEHLLELRWSMRARRRSIYRRSNAVDPIVEACGYSYLRGRRAALPWLVVFYSTFRNGGRLSSKWLEEADIGAVVHEVYAELQRGNREREDVLAMIRKVDRKISKEYQHILWRFLSNLSNRDVGALTPSSREPWEIGFTEVGDAPLTDRVLTGPELTLLRWLADAGSSDEN